MNRKILKVSMTKKFWDNIYSNGKQLNCYPYDSIVSFIYSNAPHENRNNTKILEIGCGAGNNLWFAAREGFNVTGIDQSIDALNFAKDRFKQEDLDGDFLEEDFTNLSFANNIFDIAIDRAAITCVDMKSAKKAFDELQRVLKVGGKLKCEIYAIGTTYTPEYHGYLYNEEEIRDIFSTWLVKELYYKTSTNIINKLTQNQWHIIAEKL